MSLRSRARALLDNRLRRLRSFGAEDWLSSAMIIAPHPDDETLGCGGIACKKILAGAAVSFVFVTDGGSSHSRGIGREELIKTRETEAREAVLRLGGRAEEISFLRYPQLRGQQPCGSDCRGRFISASAKEAAKRLYSTRDGLP